MSQAVEVIGYVAAALTTGAFAPQVWRTYQTRRARDLSLVMLVATLVGNGLWLTYAVIVWAPPVMAANFFTILLVGALVAMKLGQRDRIEQAVAAAVEAVEAATPGPAEQPVPVPVRIAS
jgi:MtN3 and saliva related transmembrane protein